MVLPQVSSRQKRGPRRGAPHACDARWNATVPAGDAPRLRAALAPSPSLHGARGVSPGALCAQARAAFQGLATRPAALRTPLPPEPCKASSIPRVGGPGEVAALLKRGVGGDAAAKAQRMARRAMPEISERPPTPRMMGDDPRGHGSPSCMMRDSRVGGVRPSSVAAPSTMNA